MNRSRGVDNDGRWRSLRSQDDGVVDVLLPIRFYVVSRAGFLSYQICFNEASTFNGADAVACDMTIGMRSYRRSSNLLSVRV